MQGEGESKRGDNGGDGLKPERRREREKGKRTEGEKEIRR